MRLTDSHDMKPIEVQVVDSCDVLTGQVVFRDWDAGDLMLLPCQDQTMKEHSQVWFNFFKIFIKEGKNNK